MTGTGQGWTDQYVEQLIGNLLRIGVLLAAAIVLIGGIVYLVRHGDKVCDYQTFHGEEEQYRRPTEIVQDAVAHNGRGLIQLGLLVLIATPVARVLFSVFAFFRERDYLYVGLTLVVLVVLMYSLFFSKF